MPFIPHSEGVSVLNTPELKSWLRNFTWSNSTLRSFFTCPLHFLYTHAPGYKVEVPTCMMAEDSPELLIGNIIHRWNFLLRDQRPVIERWRPLLEEIWERTVQERPVFANHGIYKPVVLGYLSEIAEYERSNGKFILFSDKIVETEKELKGAFGKGKFKISGRIDRLQQYGEKLLIVDLKYRSTITNKSSNILESLSKKGEFSDFIQLLTYASLAIQNNIATAEEIGAAFVLIKSEPKNYFQDLSPDEIKRCSTTMDEIAHLLEERIEAEEFKPNYRSDICGYCLYAPLCLHPQLLSGR